MAKRTSPRKGSRRGRATTTKQKAERRSPFQALRERVRSGFGRHADDVWGMVFIVLGVLTTLSFFDLAGPVGRGVVSHGLSSGPSLAGVLVLGGCAARGKARRCGELVFARPPWRCVPFLASLEPPENFSVGLLSQPGNNSDAWHVCTGRGANETASFSYQ